MKKRYVFSLTVILFASALFVAFNASVLAEEKSIDRTVGWVMVAQAQTPPEQAPTE